MAQAKKKQATKTTKKSQAKCCAKQKKRFCYEKYDKTQKSNMVFVICMSILATTLLFADLLMMA